MATFPTSVGEVTTEWLTESLDVAGVPGGGAVVGFDVEPIGVGVGLMGLLYRLTLRYDGGTTGPATAVLKVPAPHDGTRHVARTFRFYEKEVGFYRDLAAHTPFTTAACFTGHWDAESDDFVLLLADITEGDVHSQVDGCPSAVAEVAVRALARHHAAFADSPLFDKAELEWVPFGWDPPLPQGVAQGVADSWEPFRALFPDLVTPELEAIAETYSASVPSLLTSPEGRPITLVHGDYRLDNLFFGAGGEVTVLDWQIMGKGGFAYDVAYFISQSMTIDDRRADETRLIDAYFDGLEAAGCAHDRDDFMTDYRRTLMFCLAYPIQAGAQIDLVNERARELVVEMFGRCMAAIRDHDATEFLPG